MNVLIIDGQGGRIGAGLVASLKEKDCAGEIVAVGANTMATQAMMKAGADRSATGENPVVVTAAQADVIAGPIGILAANALLGEITPKMALAVSESRAQKILIPVGRCNITVAGAGEPPLGACIEKAAEMIAALCAQG